MARLVASGVVRLRLDYTVLRNPASMYFHVAVGREPTRTDVETLAEFLHLWDYGALPGRVNGYRLFRSELSELVGVYAESLSPRDPRPATYYTRDVSTTGIDPSNPPAPQVCGLMRWLTIPGSNRREGRTYMVGLGVDSFKESDPERLADDSVGLLGDVFQSWLNWVQESGAGLPVLLSYRVNGVVPPDLPISPIQTAAAGDTLCGTQRRRLRR